MSEPTVPGSSLPPPLPPAAGAPPEPLPTTAAVGAPAAQSFRLRFGGDGGDYFRIWIVNLVLTILTLGIYSAWAKVRRTRYFHANVQLDGVAFQYHGQPGAILRGRLLVAALFLAYSLAGVFSVAAGLVALTVLALLAPWFFFKAMRFRLTNTSWRGLRFGFASRAGEAYQVLLPAVVLWVAFVAMAPRGPTSPGQLPPTFGLFIALELLFFALLPYFHARLKRYQHGATTFGALRFSFEPSTGAFYGLYLKAAALMVLPAITAGVVAAIVIPVLTRSGASGGEVGLVALFLAFALLYAVSGAYYFSRMLRLVWSRTRGGPLSFQSDLSARSFAWLILKVGLLTVVTLGFYWPWAAVALVRAQVESVTVTASQPLATITAGQQPVERSAAGEGAMDLFGWDLGL